MISSQENTGTYTVVCCEHFECLRADLLIQKDGRKSLGVPEGAETAYLDQLGDGNY